MPCNQDWKQRKRELHVVRLRCIIIINRDHWLTNLKAENISAAEDRAHLRQPQQSRYFHENFLVHGPLTDRALMLKCRWLRPIKVCRTRHRYHRSCAEAETCRIPKRKWIQNFLAQTAREALQNVFDKCLPLGMKKEELWSGFLIPSATSQAEILCHVTKTESREKESFMLFACVVSSL